jgi:hypothetical protein
MPIALIVILVIVSVYGVAIVGNFVVPPLIYYMAKWWEYWRPED